ncbi:transcription termination factor MTERF2, chloroplastic-like [Dioscorea cayenensis subsp. rotundata]|uniref:Transcription termination factor MTERF2, chloroplastic-like n=1 Tax=Dioscorea cayennensis subsp. rotundata TaxID=55577 RepID=A0AB40BBK9_DIOCR|nr:transcription termination factor MTERF2, chloroplastic-like [Dioscorea cayenensis subsp. rotundata]
MFPKLSFRRGFAAATAAAEAKAKAKARNTNFMAEYLVSTLGFSTVEAAKASKSISHLKSPQRPDSIVSFFKSHGFDQSQIKKLVSWHPRWLCFDLHKTLTPKFQAFKDFGFSDGDIVHLITSNPGALHLSLEGNLLPKLKFWRDFLGSGEYLMTLVKRGNWMMTTSLTNVVIPNLTFLRECGVSDERIVMVVCKTPRFILQKREKLETAVELVDCTGVPRRSGLFLWAIWAVYLAGKAKFYAKLEMMKSFGWSEADFFMAFRRAPVFILVSEKMVREKMKFLLKDVGCESSYVVEHPDLLMYSLEKRLLPRYRVVEILKSRGLRRRDYDFRTVMCRSEKYFLEKIVLRNIDKVPELHQVYNCGICSGFAV